MKKTQTIPNRKRFTRPFGMATVLVVIFVGILLAPRAGTAGEADVAVALYGPALDIYTNDWMPYTVNVNNLGPSAATNVTVASTMPSGFAFLGVSPASQSYTFATNTLTLNFGTLTNLAVRNVGVRLKPTNSGTFTLTGTANSTGSTDPNSANNTNSINFTVGTLISGPLVASIISTQAYDAQTGFMVQWIQVSNSAASPAASARVAITGLTNELYNASGTNNGDPYVIYASKLDAGQSGNLLLEFNVPSRQAFPLTNSQLKAFETALPALVPPKNLGQGIPMRTATRGSSTGFVPGRIINFFWNSPTGRSYTILYSDNPEFGNALYSPDIVQPSTFDQVQWIDYGPPATLSPPTRSTPRYYRAFPNP
jgi:uncharacterized repeat protein (TIGR01451 family)